MSEESRKRKYSQGPSQVPQPQFLLPRPSSSTKTRKTLKASRRLKAHKSSKTKIVKSRSFRFRSPFTPNPARINRYQIFPSVDLSTPSTSEKKSTKKRIIELPALFGRLLTMKSKSDETGTSVPQTGEMCMSAEPPRNRWSTLRMRLAGYRTPATTQQVQQSSSVASSDPLYSILGPSTSQVIAKNVKSPTTARADGGVYRKTEDVKRTEKVRASPLPPSVPLAPSMLPKVIGNMSDDFSMVIYPQGKSSSHVHSSFQGLQSSHSSQFPSSNLEPSLGKASSTVFRSEPADTTKLESFGAVSLTVPDKASSLSSWKQIQKRFLKYKRQSSDPKMSFDIQNKEGVVTSVKSSLTRKPGSSTLKPSSSKSDPYGEVPQTPFPVLEPLHAEVALSTTSTTRSFPKTQNFATNSPFADSSTTPPRSVNPSIKSIKESSDAAIRLGYQMLSSAGPSKDVGLRFPPPVGSMQIKTSAPRTLRQNDDHTRKNFPDSLARSSQATLIHPQSSSNPLPVSTQILNPVHHRETYKLASFGVRSIPQVSARSRPRASTCEAGWCMKFHPGSAIAAAGESTHLEVAHSSHAVYSPTPSVLQSFYARQVPTSVTIPSRSLREQQMFETIYGSAAANAMTSDVISSLIAQCRNEDPESSAAYSQKSYFYYLHKSQKSSSEDEYTEISEQQSSLSALKKPEASDSSLPKSESPFLHLSTSSSGESIRTWDLWSAYAATKASRLVSERGCSCQVLRESDDKISPISTARGNPASQFGAATSMSSSTSIIAQSSTGISCSCGQNRATLSLTNLLLADSATSESSGSDAGNSKDRPGVNSEGQVDRSAASSSLAPDMQFADSDSLLVGEDTEDRSFIRQPLFKKRAIKIPGKLFRGGT